MSESVLIAINAAVKSKMKREAWNPDFLHEVWVEGDHLIWCTLGYLAQAS